MFTKESTAEQVMEAINHGALVLTPVTSKTAIVRDPCTEEVGFIRYDGTTCSQIYRTHPECFN